MSAAVRLREDYDAWRLRALAKAAQDANQTHRLLAPGGLAVVHFRQARDAMSLQAAMQRGARQVREGGLQRIQAVIKRQKGVLAEGDDDRLLFG